MELPLKRSGISSEIYLDYAGMVPAVKEVVSAVAGVLSSQSLGNPHSGGHSSQRAQAILSQGRACVLDFFGASPLEYYVVFTAGATASIKLVGETFRWSSESVFACTLENHTSVVGLRSLAVAAGASACVVDLDSSSFPAQLTHSADSLNLFAFPGECNFSGDMYFTEGKGTGGYTIMSRRHVSDFIEILSTIDFGKDILLPSKTIDELIP